MTFSPQAAKEAVRTAAAMLGFADMGVAPAHIDQGTSLQEWIADGQHADMEWMERHLPARLNPQLVLDGVQSVIMLTYDYAPHDARKAGGHIARYAQGEDYHKLLAGKLADLDETLQIYGGNQRYFTDSGPVSERFFAAQAGLGWIGRNGLLIRPGRGSYCFLACILTTLKLPYDRPIRNYCGNCHRCEQACPTAALHHGQCDARRCLSYWTIEAHSPTPEAISQKCEERLYGCDICQEVCPWNRFAHMNQTDIRLLMPAPLAEAEPATLNQLTEDAFEKLFQRSPIRRIGLNHLQENLRHITPTPPPNT